MKTPPGLAAKLDIGGDEGNEREVRRGDAELRGDLRDGENSYSDDSVVSAGVAYCAHNASNAESTPATFGMKSSIP